MCKRTLSTSAIVSLVALIFVPGLAHAQYETSPWPAQLPPEPQSFMGGVEKDRAVRQFYENLESRFRAETEQSRNELRKQRAADQVARRLASEDRTERARAKNLAWQLKRDLQTASQASELLDKIHCGSVDWPIALQQGKAAQLVGEACSILKGMEVFDVHGEQRVIEIARELRQVLRGKGMINDDLEHAKAMRIVRLLEHLADSMCRNSLANN